MGQGCSSGTALGEDGWQLASSHHAEKGTSMHKPFPRAETSPKKPKRHGLDTALTRLSQAASPSRDFTVPVQPQSSVDINSASPDTVKLDNMFLFFSFLVGKLE